MATKKNGGKSGGQKSSDTKAAKLEAKLIEKIGQDVVDTLRSANADELSEKTGLLAKYEDETEEARDNDEEIKSMTDELNAAKAPYKETLDGIKLQRRFIGMLLRERGTKKSG